MGCDFPFPVPWRKIPENIYFTVRFIYGILTRPDFKDTNKQLQAYGIPKAAALPRPDIPWISQNMLEASIPLEVVPPNVTSAGPIVLDTEPAAQQDPELAAWLARAPTVLVNLGSLFTYSEEQATAMAQAIQDLLSGTEVQVLWKMAKESTYSETYALPLRSYIDAGRLRIVDWLTIDPVALLETGHIVASVHHGGANCYHEAIAYVTASSSTEIMYPLTFRSAGIPQVIIPLWLDLYNYAQLAEDIGVGVYATRGTAPQWTVEGLRDSFLRAVDGGEESLRMRKKAKELGDIAQREPGRYVAAKVIAGLAESGYA